MSDQRLLENCAVEVLSDRGTPLYGTDECDVRFEGDQLVISYWDDEGAVVFGGLLHDDGRWELWCRSRPVRAVLRRSADGRRLEGTWRNDEANGSWWIELPDGP